MKTQAFRRQSQRDALAALGARALELVKTHTINETLALLPGVSRATLYRAMRVVQQAADPLLL